MDAEDFQFAKLSPILQTSAISFVSNANEWKTLLKTVYQFLLSGANPSRSNSIPLLPVSITYSMAPRTMASNSSTSHDSALSLPLNTPYSAASTGSTINAAVTTPSITAHQRNPNLTLAETDVSRLTDKAVSTSSRRKSGSDDKGSIIDLSSTTTLKKRRIALDKKKEYELKAQREKEEEEERQTKAKQEAKREAKEKKKREKEQERCREAEKAQKRKEEQERIKRQQKEDLASKAELTALRAKLAEIENEKAIEKPVIIVITTLFPS
jgi:hypothetical protein